MTLFEALTGGAFDRLTGNIAGNLTKLFQKSQMPGGLPGGGGMGGFGIDRYITSPSIPLQPLVPIATLYIPVFSYSFSKGAEHMSQFIIVK